MAGRLGDQSSKMFTHLIKFVCMLSNVASSHQFGRGQIQK